MGSSHRRSNAFPVDDDERLLASEEGKKLSSKERRQLRNKVSARHFRLRRKEYITHLEQLVSDRTAEAHTLKAENERLAAENRRLAETLSQLSLSPNTGLSPSASATSSFLSPASDSLDVAPAVDEFDFLSPAEQLQQTLASEESFGMNSSNVHSATPVTRITPRIVNLLPTYNTRKDASPYSLDWPLAYANGAVGSAGPSPSSTPVPNAAQAGAMGMPISNMQVFNTLVPEWLAELEKAAVAASAPSPAVDGETQQEVEAPRTTVTVRVLSSKPDKEESRRNAPESREGIWEDAFQAAEEVYRRLGIHMASLSLDDEEDKPTGDESK
ncbi:uncharacterized protein V1518DRAFT_375549 [Limtongia smithiae]|uniref:uncharacterized protein n=1 Tax=Limtongia smithiae TaxID=1125753 RepID=UPI0034CE6317